MLIEGELYEGTLNRGPCKGTVILVKYRGISSFDKEIYEVMKDIEFGPDPEWPDDDGWIRVGEVLSFAEGAYDFTLYNPILENK